MQVVTVRMDEELIRKSEELAKLRGITRSVLIKEILGRRWIVALQGSFGKLSWLYAKGRSLAKR
ncbi:ribbon-helix-helix domain-containing protein [Thermodesulfovibrionales bacterium]|nr:ribbon-helix-helix domain-containing protein [Thermodesulfovibrionales bacterium]